MKIIIPMLLITFIVLYLYIRKRRLNTSTRPKTKEIVYYKKKLMTDYEIYFFDILNENFQDEYYILPQINLASIVKKKKAFKNQYQNELYRNIDFGLINKKTLTTNLLIEINDKTHNEQKRIQRDKKVKEICKQANINLITFYSNMPNKKNYVVNRINKELKKDSN